MTLQEIIEALEDYFASSLPGNAESLKRAKEAVSELKTSVKRGTEIPPEYVEDLDKLSQGMESKLGTALRAAVYTLKIINRTEPVCEECKVNYNT